MSNNKKNLVYFCIFNKEYIELFEILITTIKFYSDINNIDILVFTSNDFKPHIDKISNNIEIAIITKLYDCNNTTDVLSSRTNIFDYDHIHLYNKVLYLDCDIIVQNDLSILFENDIGDNLYCMKESTGILLFKPSTDILQIFRDIYNHINIIKNSGESMSTYLDKTLINYHFIKNNKYDTELLQRYGHIYSHNMSPPSRPTNVILCHFTSKGTCHKDTKRYMLEYVTHILNKYIDLKWFIPLFTDPDLSNITYKWSEHGIIKFWKGCILETTWCYGSYKWLDLLTVEASWAGYSHILRMTPDYSKFFTIRKGDIICGVCLKNTDTDKYLENSYDYIQNKNIANSSITSIILTMTVNVGNKVTLAQKNSDDRKNTYIKSIRQWLNNTKFNIVCVENSGCTFDELFQERVLHKDRFEIITFNENTLPESKYLTDNSDKGASEFFSINYAYKHSNLLNMSNFIIKITGRYYIAELEDFLKNYNLNSYDAIRQGYDYNRPMLASCELVGSHIKNFDYIFKRNIICFNRAEQIYHHRLKDYKNILVCKEFKIEPTVTGSFGTLMTQL